MSEQLGSFKGEEEKDTPSATEGNRFQQKALKHQTLNIVEYSYRSRCVLQDILVGTKEEKKRENRGVNVAVQLSACQKRKSVSPAEW